MRRDRNYKLYLEDIEKSLDSIGNYIKNISEEQFKKDEKLQDAVIRRLEIIGEAVKNIPKSVRDKNKLIPWEEFSRIRDTLAHSYFEASLNRIWNIITIRAPYIREELKKIKLL